jgi:putative tryptophan/tyrosine transport system substrate-binding protein
VKEKIFVLVVGSFILGAIYLAEAQQPADIPRIGFVHSAGTPANPSPQFDAFRAGLQDLGYLEGKNILIDPRYAEGRLDRMPELVHDLVQQKVVVIVAPNNVAIQAAKKATKTIHITGLTTISRDLSAKRVELLKEVLPRMTRVAILWDASGPGPGIAFKEYEAAAHAFKLELRSLEVQGPRPDLDKAFQTAKAARAEALIVVRNPLMGRHAKQVFELAIKSRVASMTEESQYVDAGGLISYGANAADLYRRAAEYVVEILKGAKPRDLPVKLPAKFEIFINLKTAQQLGLVIPQHVLVQADKVIKE